MADQKSRRTTLLLAIWFLAGWAITTLGVRLIFGPHVEYYADPAQPPKVFTPLGLPVEAHQGILISCLFAGWPILVWPRIAKTEPFWEADWRGYLCWLVIWFLLSHMIAFFLVILGRNFGSNWAGGFAVLAVVFYHSVSFFGIWALPRLLIPGLWPGVFGSTAEHARASATDAPADPRG